MPFDFEGLGSDPLIQAGLGFLGGGGSFSKGAQLAAQNLQNADQLTLARGKAELARRKQTATEKKLERTQNGAKFIGGILNIPEELATAETVQLVNQSGLGGLDDFELPDGTIATMPKNMGIASGLPRADAIAKARKSGNEERAFPSKLAASKADAKLKEQKARITKKIEDGIPLKPGEQLLWKQLYSRPVNPLDALLAGGLEGTAPQSALPLPPASTGGFKILDN